MNLFNRIGQKKLIIIAVVALILTILCSIGWRYRPYAFHGMVMASAEPAPNFTLTSSRTGEPISLRDFEGKVVLIYFGYTTCPDVCPATLSDIAESLDLLGRKANQVQMLWITVDPERDTPEIMEDYVKHFHPDFLGLTPRTAEETFSVASQYGIYYEKQYYGSEAGYLMDHTATVILVDKESKIRVIYPFGTTPEDMAADLKYILSRW